MPPDRPWFKHYPPEVPKELNYPFRPLGDLLREAARRFPDRTATLFFGAKMTYRELDEQADRFATALHQMGVRKGDRVAAYLPNCPPYAITYSAVLRLGAVLVNNNPLYTERELEHQLTDSGAKVLVFWDLLMPTVKSVWPKVPSVERYISASFKPYLPPLLRLLFPVAEKKILKERYPNIEKPPTKDPHVADFTTLIRTTSPALPKVDLAPGDPALLQYTGGTTGKPKSAVLTHGSIGANVVQLKTWFYKDEPGKETAVLIFPMFHAAGMIIYFQALAMATSMIQVPRFDRDRPDRFLKLVQKHSPTTFPGVPTLFNALASYPDIGKYNLKTVKYCLSGAAPMPLEVAHRWKAATGASLVEVFGLTEASPVTHANPVYGDQKLGSVGLPLPGTDAKIVDASDEKTELPPGKEGELIISGPQLMASYWNRPEESAKALRNGWLYTGDLAKMDEEGFFYIVDRKKDMIIAGGYNVYPNEIEGILYEHPKILEAAIIGVKDEYRGEAPKAFIVLKPGEKATAEELITYCKSKLAAYKVPKLIEFRDTLPKSVIGKVLRRELRDEKAS